VSARAGLAVAALAVCALAHGGEVACPGAYPGHLQGIARDDDGNLYWSFTTFLIKTDASGVERAKVTVPTHYGDLTWHAGKVYVAVNYGAFNKESGKAKSWVCVHDAGSLALLASNAVPEVVHGAGGMEWHDGRFFIVGGLPETHSANYVYEYSESFVFQRRHVIASGWTHLGIQTVCRAGDGTWFFGCYGKPAVTLRTDDTFRFLGKHAFDSSVGIARAPGPGELLVAKNVRSQTDKRNTATVTTIRAATILEK
jgi:hypothetical protein